jgi:hypothetical protein
VERPVSATGVASRPVRRWHLALLPVVVGANWLFMTTRHEAAHGAVVLAFGGEIAAIHVWPPRAGSLSWITFRLPLGAPRAAVALQAAAPYVVALGILAAGVHLVCRRLPRGLLRANVALTAVLFPCCEIATTAVGYLWGGGDLAYVLGTPTRTVRWGVTGAAAVLVGTALALVGWRIFADDGAERIRHG